MRVQVLLDPLRERQHHPRRPGRSRANLFWSALCASALLPTRPPAASPNHGRDAIAVGPQRLTVRARRLQLEDLTLLDHLGTSSIDNETEESHPDNDHHHPLTQRCSGIATIRTDAPRIAGRSSRADLANEIEDVHRPGVSHRRAVTVPHRLLHAVTSRKNGRTASASCVRWS